MLTHVVQAEGYSVSGELQKYTQKKLDSLERYIPRSCRRSAHVEVRFKQKASKDKNRKFNTCELTLHLPGDTLFAKETTQHMYAALDIVAVHIKQQLDDYRAKHSPRWRHRLARRLGGEWQ
ncbi:MAG TPA: ribosome-associated translation inhibitor RaiA [Candidatus Saccharimonadales bacterium]|nr:ribosome-associated translation inhibitor RaiA [Candidatus Saccharimonadales bacterium]